MSQCSVIAFVLLTFLSLSVSYYIGFDDSYYQGEVPLEAYECLYSSGYTFAIMEAQTGHPAGTGIYNPYIKDNYKNAVTAGISPVDIYIFPDYGQGAWDQVNNTVSNLLNDDVLAHGNMIWMDVEGTEYWTGTCEENIQFLTDLISAAQELYPSCEPLTECIGIYSSSAQWTPIMCETTDFNTYPLWWARYDNDTSFDDYTAFGGWDIPVMKQITGTTDICDTQIDNDYKP